MQNIYVTICCQLDRWLYYDMRSHQLFFVNKNIHIFISGAVQLCEIKLLWSASCSKKTFLNLTNYFQMRTCKLSCNSQTFFFISFTLKCPTALFWYTNVLPS